MDPKPSNPGMLLTPPASGSSAALRLPPAREPEPLPRIDDHLVQSETREQLVRGRRVVAMPSKPAHGDRHFKLDYILGAHVKDEYVGSTDLLTRVAPGSDFATDTCIRRKGINPATGARYLEELAFEIVNEQSMRDITEQAEDLSARGVRRVVAIFVKKGEVREWSAGKWTLLDPEGLFSDSTLARPLLVRELLDAAEADNAVARALLAKKNPVLDEEKTKSRQEGHTEGLKEGLEKGVREGRKEGLLEAIERACGRFAIELDAERRARINALNASDLGALLDSILAERCFP